MSPATPTGAPALSRRERNRLSTIEEIKTLARRQLAEQGPGGLSLRAIARQMGTAPSALYTHFASYEDLLGALCVDAYYSAADGVHAAVPLLRQLRRSAGRSVRRRLLPGRGRAPRSPGRRTRQ